MKQTIITTKEKMTEAIKTFYEKYPIAGYLTEVDKIEENGEEVKITFDRFESCD